MEGKNHARTRTVKNIRIHQMKKTPDFSIIFPIMNQEDHIERVIRAYHHVLSQNKFSFELIGVVNGSRDESFQVGKKTSKELPNIHIYELKQGGYGRGIVYGIKRAKGRYICYLNCARIRANELVKCLNYFLIDPGVIVHGIRRKREAWYRQLTSTIYSSTCKLLFDIDTRDINGNPNVMSNKTAQKLKLKSINSMIDLELHDKAHQNSISMVEVPIFDYTRQGGKSTSNFMTGFRLFKEVFVYYYLTRIRRS